jgi:hypothetical protein
VPSASTTAVAAPVISTDCIRSCVDLMRSRTIRPLEGGTAAGQTSGTCGSL